MNWNQISTIVRARNWTTGAYFRHAEHLLPGPAGRLARDLWFTAPPRMAQLPVPGAGEPFEVEAQGHVVRGMVWGDVAGPAGARRTVYLMHGWGGRGSQFGALVEPLLESGHRVVIFDAPAHGDSDHGPAGPRRTNGLEFAKALDAVFCRFGPAEAVVAHSLGTIATYLALRFGWLGTKRLVLIAPMVESQTLFDQFQSVLGFGERTRRAFDRSVLEWVGIAVAEFDARVQAAHVDPVPSLVITDRGDRQTPYEQVADFAESIDAPLITTEGLGHRKILRDRDVVASVVAFVSGQQVAGGSVAADGSSVA
ncbi:alpha/beta fold hydrolase [Nocardioides sp.]|uniref:alpha/beta fold hydrolase n=1 Tax=Nocardioides sp. TaxID=35761 RepID=UPI002736B2B1|nr:alpha/beta fold hydrolase [Nocardioides sp.]MDP3893053.1 alpha/beta fold hydrolase [Nocardioides sp.]